MRIWAISDLHLSFAAPKPMDIFGDRWRDHPERIAARWRKLVAEDDIVLGHQLAPARGDALGMVAPAVAEDIHRLRRRERKMQVRDGPDAHVPPLRPDAATPRTRL